jgi:hypothetical protein
MVVCERRRLVVRDEMERRGACHEPRRMGLGDDPWHAASSELQRAQIKSMRSIYQERAADFRRRSNHCTRPSVRSIYQERAADFRRRSDNDTRPSVRSIHQERSADFRRRSNHCTRLSMRSIFQERSADFRRRSNNYTRPSIARRVS